MKRAIHLFSLALIVSLLVSGVGFPFIRARASGTWEYVGPAGFSAGDVNITSIVFDDGTPYVAFHDYSNGSRLSVMKYNGTGWVYVGSAGFAEGGGGWSSFAIDNGIPYISYRDYANGGKLSVMKYNGTNWVYIGPAGFSPDAVYPSSLAIDNGTPYVAFEDYAIGSERVSVMKFNGTDWVNVGPAGFSAQDGVNISLAFDNGIPYVAYVDVSAERANVMKYNDLTGNWEMLGPADFTTDTTLEISLVFDNGIPYVATNVYSSQNYNYEANVLKFNGTDWINVGPANFSPGEAFSISLAFNNGTPYVAFEDEANNYKASVMKFSALTGSWVYVGTAGFSPAEASSISLGFNNSTPYVAYADYSKSHKASVMKYIGGIPGAPTITSPSTSPINDPTPTISGHADPGEQITISYNDSTTNDFVPVCENIVADAITGAWTCSWPSNPFPAIAEGSFSLKAKAYNGTDYSPNTVVDYVLDLQGPGTTLIVTNTNDSGAGSLREAVANADPSDTINFASSLAGQTITLAKTLMIDKNLTIDGSSLNSHIVVSGNNSVRVFQINSGLTVTLKSLDIIDGSAPYGAGVLNYGNVSCTIIDVDFTNNNASTYGGGVYNANGTLTITDSDFSSNHGSGIGGGGIYNDTGNVYILNSNFSNNSGGSPSVRGGGGAIYNYGTLIVTNSTFANNTAVLAGGAISNTYTSSLTVVNSVFSGNSTTIGNSMTSQGGGIFNLSSLNVTGTTFSENSATGEGGGIYVQSSYDNVVEIKATTFSNNHAGYDGGGIYATSSLKVTNSTFFNNTSNRNGGGIYNEMGVITLENNTLSANGAFQNGGGIYILGSTLHLKNTILANSTSQNDCYLSGDIATDVNNLIETNGTFPNACGTPIVTSDPKLGLLADNGGYTKTMALLLGSPAIDAGDDAHCPETDQRGVIRPQGSHCDMGAYEYPDSNPPVVASIMRTDANPSQSATVRFTVSFSEEVTGVNTSDFALNTAGIAGVAIQSISGSGTSYTVTVDTGPGNGKIGLSVVDDDSIQDVAGNRLGGTGLGNGNFASPEQYTKLNGADTSGVFRPSNGLLYLKNQNTTGYADIAINYGQGGDYPVVGDWDGNGTTTIGIYRAGYFYLRNANTIGFADKVFAFGAPGDQPIAGDWDGDGVGTIGVYRPSTGQFLLRNSNSAGTPDITFSLGNAGDVGIAGDWNGDGIDTVGVFRPSNGIIFLKNTNTTGYADVALNYGLPGDQPVVGDWDNNGTDTIGVYRNGEFLLRNENTNGFAETRFSLGIPGDMPIAGNWDGLP